MNRKIITGSVISAAVLAALAGSYGHFVPSGLSQAQAAVPAPVTAASPATDVAPLATTGITDFSAIVERYGPAVVNVSVTGKVQQTGMAGNSPGFDPNEMFPDFFRRFGPLFPHPPEGGQIIRGQGSGFIVSSDGVILTNAHVIDGAQEVTVKLTDRRELKAKVLGVDRQTDVAVLKIDATNLPIVHFGDPNATRVGEPVLAIGSPFGFENSATSGIVSAKSRSLPDGTYVPFIQTDVAVNPGNSGGPLFNTRGEVIGINSQIFTRTGGYEGLSFAIPIDVATKVEKQLMEHGKVTRGRLGITIQEVDQALADSFGLKKPHGALVSSVEKGSPAEHAGIEAGDIVVRLGDKEINHSADLPALVADLKPGTATQLEVIRKGANKIVAVTVGEMKTDKLARDDHNSTSQGRLGLAVRPLNRDERQQAGVSNGLLVEDASGPSALAGIHPGDVVLSLNGVPVGSVEQLRSLVAKAGKHVALLIQRDDSKIFVPINIG
ncbi:MAG: DegQ family serine endoprotease [Betaproteobacteria bacterium]|nr:DegQ family serine endoprotease [Betaproteobacteria bacterium]